MMASCNTPRKLTGSDHVSDAILSHVSHHVVPRVRKQFATGPLGLSDSEHDNIEDDSQYSKGKSCEILRAWRNKSYGVTIKTFIDYLSEWRERGYINPDVWPDMEKLVSADLLMVANSAHEAPPAKRTRLTPSGEGQKTFKDSSYIRRLLKKQLRRCCKNALRTDWLPDDKAKTFPLRDYYTNLGWKKKVKKLMIDTSYKLKRIHDVFDNEFEDGATNVALIGPAGIGKTSTLAMLAQDWANNTQDDSLKTKLDQFEFVFLIRLCQVNDNSSLEQIIIRQHGLKGKKIPESQIRSILDGDSRSKVLLLLHGYDEYQKGTNADIDAAIEDTIGDCFLILTSRDRDYISKETLDKLDGEIEIKGFNDENIQKCAAAYLENEENAKNLIKKAKGLKIYELLCIPIILLMVCVLYFKKKGNLPESQTAVIRDITNMCMDRSAINRFGKKAIEIAGIDDMLNRLGELSWKALNSKTRQLLLSKREVKNISSDLLKLGILQGTTGDEKVSLEEEPDWVMFPHKLFQEYWAAYYASRRLTNAESLKDEIDKVFNIPEDMKRHWNVLKFTCGLMDNSSLLIERICGNVVEETTRVPGSWHLYFPYMACLMDLNREKSAKSLSPLVNSEICCMNERHSVLRKNSSLYVFGAPAPRHTIDNSNFSSIPPHMMNSGSINPKPCAIIILMKLFSGKEDLNPVLVACASIDQPVRYLEISTTSLSPDRPVIERIKVVPHYQRESKANDHLLFHDEVRVQLWGVNFEHLSWIVDSVKGCTTSTQLDVSYCDRVPDDFFENLHRNTNLTHLTVGGISTNEGRYYTKLCNQLKHLTKLQQLNFKGSTFKDPLTRAINADDFSYLKCLNEVSLRFCILPCTEAVHLLMTLVQCPLENLDLSWTL